MAIKTNKDYLTISLSKFNVTEDDIDLMLVDSGLDGNSEVNPRLCKLAMHKSLSSVLPLANISEGGYSVSWNMDALKLWFSTLCKELGKEDVLRKNKVRNKSNLW